MIQAIERDGNRDINAGMEPFDLNDEQIYTHAVMHAYTFGKGIGMPIYLYTTGRNTEKQTHRKRQKKDGNQIIRKSIKKEEGGEKRST